MAHTIGNTNGMHIGMDVGNTNGMSIGTGYRYPNRYPFRSLSTIPFRFEPTHSVLSFNEYGDPFELPLQRTNCFDEKGRAEWVDEFGRFTYMTDHQSNVFLTEMIHIPV